VDVRNRLKPVNSTVNTQAAPAQRASVSNKPEPFGQDARNHLPSLTCWSRSGPVRRIPGNLEALAQIAGSWP
jgi:hypothetical protein